MVGIARTATIRSTHPSDLSADAMRQLSDAYYAYIDAGAKPSIVVIQDIDENRGYGAFWGEVNSAIHWGLGCVGLITDGGVADKVKEAAEQIVRRERVIIEAARQPGFNVEKLRAARGRAAEIH